MYFHHSRNIDSVKGILNQFFFFRLNLIFCTVMGRGRGNFDRGGLKTTKTLKFWSQNLSPGVQRRGGPGVSRHSSRGLEGQQEGFGGAAGGVQRGRKMGPQGKAALIEHLTALSLPAVPLGPWYFRWDFEGYQEMIKHRGVLSVLPCFKVPSAAPRNPSCCASKPLLLPLETPPDVPRNPRSAAPRNPWGQILRPKFSNFGGFQAPPTKTSYTTPHYYPKYEIQAIEIFLVEDPFKILKLQQKYASQPFNSWYFYLSK